MNKKKYWITLFALSFIVVGLVVLFNRPYEQKPIIGQLKVGIQNDPASGLLVVAQNRGYFESEGLDVTLLKYDSGKLAADALFSDQLDLATAADVVVVGSFFSNYDFSVLASVAQISDPAWILARRDRGIMNPSDLAHKKIGTQKDSAVHFFLSRFLEKNKLESTATIVFMQPDELSRALESGAVDAISMRNPYVAEVKQRIGAKKTVEFYDGALYSQFFNLLVQKKFSATHEKELTAFLRALKRAADYIVSKPDSSQSIIKNSVAGDGGEMSNKFSYDLTIDQALILNLEKIARWEQKDNVVTPNFLPIFDYKLLEAVYPAGVSIIH